MSEFTFPTLTVLTFLIVNFASRPVAIYSSGRTCGRKVFYWKRMSHDEIKTISGRVNTTNRGRVVTHFLMLFSAIHVS